MSGEKIGITLVYVDFFSYLCSVIWRSCPNDGTKGNDEGSCPNDGTNGNDEEEKIKVQDNGG